MAQQQACSVGQRVRIGNDLAMRAWGLNGRTGTVVSSDPRGTNESVVTVRLDDESPSIAETKGIHSSHLELIE